MVKATIDPEIIREAIKPFKEDVKLCISNDGIFLRGESTIITEKQIEEPPFAIKEKEVKEIIRKIPSSDIIQLEAEKEFCCLINTGALRHISSTRGGKIFKKVAIDIEDKDGSIEFKQKVWEDAAPADIERSFTQRCMIE